MKQLENVLLYIIPLFFIIKKKTYVQNQQQKLLNNSHLRRFDVFIITFEHSVKHPRWSFLQRLTVNSLSH